MAILKAGAWLSLLFLAVVTLVPIELRPVSGLPVGVERFGAVAIVGFVFALAYPRRLLVVAALLILATVSLELLQLLAPGRHARLFDALVKISGAVVGLAAGWYLPLVRPGSGRS